MKRCWSTIFTESGENTYFATDSLENKSLTLPPATLRKADPQKPVIKRKMKYTADENENEID